jgi:hypothetical protein
MGEHLPEYVIAVSMDESKSEFRFKIRYNALLHFDFQSTTTIRHPPLSLL